MSISKNEWKIGCDGFMSKNRAPGSTRCMLASNGAQPGAAEISLGLEVVDDHEAALLDVGAQRRALLSVIVHQLTSMM